MPFSTFEELSDEIIRYTHRGDLDLRIPDFIILAEKEMFNNPVEQLAIKYLEKTSTAPTTTTSRFIALPDDYESLRSSRLAIDNESDFLEFRAPEQMRRYDITGRPCFFTIIGTQIEFDRTPDKVITIEIQYNAETIGLTKAAPTNALLTNHPDIYLYGSLYKAFTFAQDQESAATYQNLFYSAIKGANKSDKKGRFAVAPVMRVDGPTP